MSTSQLTARLNRRTMISGFGLAGLALMVAACGDGAHHFSTLSELNIDGEVNGSISTNHGHKALLTKEQLSKGEALELNIQGGSNHPHIVSLTAEQVIAISKGKEITVLSTKVGNHQHTIQFKIVA